MTRARCPYYFEFKRNSDWFGDVARTVVPWCAHKRSPAPRNLIFVRDGEKVLKCAGDLDKCQLREDDKNQW